MEFGITGWEAAFTKVGAFWMHDRHPKRPYARLTSGKISDGFFNADRIARKPGLLERAVGHLVHHPAFRSAIEEFSPQSGGRISTPPSRTTMSEDVVMVDERQRDDFRVVGAAYGGITLAHATAHHAGCEMAYAIKYVLEEGGVKIGERLSLDRFEHDFIPGQVVVLVEDTVTSGGTLLKLRDEVLRVCPEARIVPCVLALCNRSGEARVNEMEIASLIAPRFRVWEEGKNPFTPDGKELVPPLRPKGKNWHALTRTYY